MDFLLASFAAALRLIGSLSPDVVEAVEKAGRQLGPKGLAIVKNRPVHLEAV